ncbi:retrovirus-related Pol polyprotein from transposon TNT 1-94 [Nephila pilipes]|uniref:Retrovirus-related Pol polyprotein from transposon TNT 1-94 n=1 Tax=Nephila pilipes TaxID=299642 RepID=A0A8X6T2F9_NEPPI|nr:retrovirus-related Pol polyprotein from transposon TNT 1-94 [Nephila pilipes]
MEHKARLEAKGYNQKFGTDYDETVAPVVKHIDMKTEFLHGNLHEDIYMKQPEGYVKLGEEQKVCKLKKSIYGLKQAAKAWNQKIAEVLQINNFKQSIEDNCLFTKEEKGKIILVILYVDDQLVASCDGNKINEILRTARKVRD